MNTRSAHPRGRHRTAERSVNVKHAVLLGLVFLLTGTGASAQERFSDLVEVTEVEVPVRVLVKGKPLAGLQQEDFELYDEGALQTIVGFRVLEQNLGQASETVSEPATLEADASGRRLLLLFDFSHSRPQRLAHALRGMRSSLAKQLAPGDRVAVATYGYVSGINLLVGFTTDREKMNLAFDAVQAMLDARGKKQRQILEQLHTARFPSSDGAPDSSTYATLAEELGSTAALAVLTGPVIYDDEVDDGVVVEEQQSVWGPIKLRVEVDVREPIFVAQDRVDSDVDTSAIRAFGLALSELTTLLRDVGGQKDMVLISEGFSGALLENARSMFFLQKAFRAFRDSGWTLHGVDVGGVPGLGEVGFESGSLFFMTDATGGDLIENVNDFSMATRKVLQRTSVVYVLAFQPREKGTPGEFRQLSVKLRYPPKGVDIVHRPGYYTTVPASQRNVFQRRMDAAQWLMTNLEASELQVRVYAETVTDAMGGTRVPIAVEVGGDSLMSIETRRVTRLELQLAVLDSESQVQEILNGETKVQFARMSDTLANGGVRFVGELGLVPGDYQLRVLVRSNRKGEVFLGTFPLVVGGGVETLLPPLPPESERRTGGWLTVPAERRTAYFQ